jgi:hypothetical protein
VHFAWRWSPTRTHGTVAAVAAAAAVAATRVAATAAANMATAAMAVGTAVDTPAVMADTEVAMRLPAMVLRSTARQALAWELLVVQPERAWTSALAACKLARESMQTLATGALAVPWTHVEAARSRRPNPIAAARTSAAMRMRTSKHERLAREMQGVTWAQMRMRMLQPRAMPLRAVPIAARFLRRRQLPNDRLKHPRREAWESP